MKHTKEKWSIHNLECTDSNGGCFIVDNDGDRIAKVYGDTDEDIANAFLIAAAPRLLKMIEKLCYRWVEKEDGYGKKLLIDDSKINQELLDLIHIAEGGGSVKRSDVESLCCEKCGISAEEVSLIADADICYQCDRDKEVVKKLYDGQMSDTLNNVRIGEVVSMGYDKRDLGICSFIDCGEDGERDFVVFNNLKKDNTKGKLYKSFNRFSKFNVQMVTYNSDGWEEDARHIEWKRKLL